MEREITINFMGPIRRPQGFGQSGMWAIEQGKTVGHLLTEMGYDSVERNRVRVLGSGGESLLLTDLLDEAESVTIFLPLGGG